MPDFNTMLKAAGLWRRTSAKGNEYFVGRLGGEKVLLLENRDKQSDAGPTRNLFFAEATAKDSAKAANTPPDTGVRRVAHEV
ncbi:MAG: hypothetical protein IPK78_18585 [Rhodospirillales bacterium]|nr:hypothetical protein [Rhodospirillales bacterium]